MTAREDRLIPNLYGLFTLTRSKPTSPHKSASKLGQYNNKAVLLKCQAIGLKFMAVYAVEVYMKTTHYVYVPIDADNKWYPVSWDGIDVFVHYGYRWSKSLIIRGETVVLNTYLVRFLYNTPEPPR